MQVQAGLVLLMRLTELAWDEVAYESRQGHLMLMRPDCTAGA